MSSKTCPVNENVLFHNRVWIISLIMVVIALFFWQSSRYPMIFGELDRAQTDRTTERKVGQLSKSEHYPIASTDDTFERLTKTTGNWIYANRKGMSFGIVFGGAILTLLIILLPYRHHFRHDGPEGAFVGMLAGMPLGVCANCVAPIGAAMRKEGIGLTSTLAAMVASPTMNPVGLVVIFTAFPFALAISRVAAVFVLIMVVVPFIVRYVIKEKEKKPKKVKVIVGQEPFEISARFVFKTFFMKTLWLAAIMIPLMLLGGFLGAVIVTFVPLEMFGIQGSVVLTLAAIVSAAFIGALLPVTTLADVVLVVALAQAGVSTPILATLLVALPSTSIFSAIILAKFFSRNVAFTVVSSVILVSIATGIMAYIFM